MWTKGGVCRSWPQEEEKGKACARKKAQVKKKVWSRRSVCKGLGSGGKKKVWCKGKG